MDKTSHPISRATLAIARPYALSFMQVVPMKISHAYIMSSVHTKTN
jgi:hypothetical protein